MTIKIGDPVYVVCREGYKSETLEGVVVPSDYEDILVLYDAKKDLYASCDSEEVFPLTPKGKASAKVYSKVCDTYLAELKKEQTKADKEAAKKKKPKVVKKPQGAKRPEKRSLTAKEARAEVERLQKDIASKFGKKKPTGAKRPQGAKRLAA